MAAKHKNIEPKSTKQQAYCGGKFEEVFSPIVKLMKMYLLGKVKAAGRLQFSFLINFTIFILGYSYLIFNSGLRHLHKFLKIRNLKANFFDRNDLSTKLGIPMPPSPPAAPSGNTSGLGGAFQFKGLENSLELSIFLYYLHQRKVQYRYFLMKLRNMKQS